MGVETVKLAESKEQVQEFIKYLLKDIWAMERMLEDDLFETDTVRIGAEQELCLVDKYAKPAPISMELLEVLNDKDFTTELAKFNLETNLEPLVFKGTCLSQMESNILKQLDKAREAIRQFDGDIVLTGVLPTIRKSDLDIENLTPLPRYHALCQAINKLRGDEYDLRIQGMDELLMRFDSPLLEACNTGFQVHLQVAPGEFVNKYNIAQAITGPVLASAVNSPILFGKRLWAETRVALFHQSVDTRQVGDHLRDSSPRVTFGNEWLKNSILDIIKERTEAAQTGSYWMVKSYNSLTKKDVTREQALTAITNAMIKNQRKGEPVHKWSLAKTDDLEMWQPSSLLVEEFMTTDLFTVQKDDIIELVANLFEWRRIRYVPVEDDSKHLVGLITMRMIFLEFNNIIHNNGSSSKSVGEIMIKNPITIHPEASILEATDIMDTQSIGCLPVVKNNRLVGIITEQNYMTITARLLRRHHSENNKESSENRHKE
ncbi:MAG: CBS domain-containing protein [Balneolaceae bacterium]|nr:CBS domain-containing protein [Balneolaceae bacterium]